MSSATLVAYEMNSESHARETQKVQRRHALGCYRLPDSEAACGSTLARPESPYCKSFVSLELHHEEV